MRPPVVILCGGRGTRLREETASMPKALVEIGAKPILGHVIEIYLRYGFTRVILATGYRGEMIESFVNGQPWPKGVTVECVQTGVDTPTGGRIAKLAERLRGGTFCLTYADGVADIDLEALLDRHAEAGTAATVTVVRPRLQWGVANLGPGDTIDGFTEKPLSEHWVNGGFFCLEPDALELFDEQTVLERQPLETLAAAGQLAAYRHSGFWDCMDTYKDAIELNDLWRTGKAPWATPGSVRA